MGVFLYSETPKEDSPWKIERKIEWKQIKLEFSNNSSRWMSSPSFIEFGQPPVPRSDTLSQSGPLNWWKTVKIQQLQQTNKIGNRKCITVCIFNHSIGLIIHYISSLTQYLGYSTSLPQDAFDLFLTRKGDKEREKKSLILAGKIRTKKKWVGWKWELLFALVIGQEAVLSSRASSSIDLYR